MRTRIWEINLKVADLLLKARGFRKRVVAQQFEQQFGLRAKVGLWQLVDIPPGQAVVDQFPFHHFSSRLHFETGVLRPLRIDSRMPGMERRYSVS